MGLLVGRGEVQDLGRLTGPFRRGGVGNLFTVKEGLGVKLSGHQAGLRLIPALPVPPLSAPQFPHLFLLQLSLKAPSCPFTLYPINSMVHSSLSPCSENLLSQRRIFCLPLLAIRSCDHLALGWVPISVPSCISAAGRGKRDGKEPSAW